MKDEEKTVKRRRHAWDTLIDWLEEEHAIGYKAGYENSAIDSRTYDFAREERDSWKNRAEVAEAEVRRLRAVMENKRHLCRRSTD